MGHSVLLSKLNVVRAHVGELGAAQDRRPNRRQNKRNVDGRLTSNGASICVVAGLLTVALQSAVCLAQPYFDMFPPPANPNYGGAILGLSADGTRCLGFDGGGEFIWDRGIGRQVYSVPGHPLTAAGGLSNNGRYVVGEYANGNYQAYRQDLTNGDFAPIGVGAPSGSEPLACKSADDGSVVAGNTSAHSGGEYTYSGWVWSQSSGMQNIGSSFEDVVRDMTPDGATIVGGRWSVPGNLTARPFVWHAGVTTMLPMLTNAVVGDIAAVAVSADGRVIAGGSPASDGHGHAVIWRDGTAVDLGVPAGRTDATLTDLSDDGETAIGEAWLNSTRSPDIVWTEPGGIEALDAYLVRNGVNIPSGWSLYATALSGDGMTIAGFASSGASTDVFVATIPRRGRPSLSVRACSRVAVVEGDPKLESAP